MEKEEMVAAGIGAADLLAGPYRSLIVNLSIAAMKSDHWRSDGPAMLGSTSRAGLLLRTWCANVMLVQRFRPKSVTENWQPCSRHSGRAFTPNVRRGTGGDRRRAASGSGAVRTARNVRPRSPLLSLAPEQTPTITSSSVLDRAAVQSV